MRPFAILLAVLVLPLCGNAEVVVISEPSREPSAKPYCTDVVPTKLGHIWKFSNGAELYETYGQYVRRLGKPVLTCTTGHCGSPSAGPVKPCDGCTCGCVADSCNCHHSPNVGVTSDVILTQASLPAERVPIGSPSNGRATAQPALIDIRQDAEAEPPAASLPAELSISHRAQQLANAAAPENDSAGRPAVFIAQTETRYEWRQFCTPEGCRWVQVPVSVPTSQPAAVPTEQLGSHQHAGAGMRSGGGPLRRVGRAAAAPVRRVFQARPVRRLLGARPRLLGRLLGRGCG